jgi:type II restriction enzyme
MANREDLRRTRKGTVINVSSRKMESLLMVAVTEVIERLEAKFEVTFEHSSKMYLKDITSHLSSSYPEIEFKHHFESSFLTPDGGFLFMLDRHGKRHTILISEAKRQGTNDLRASEGLAKQSKGNAIERLGKNVIGFRTWMATENILPFVVFGEGVDFDNDSSILDRVSTIAMFAPLNRVEVANLGEHGKFNRGSFFFRVERWTAQEMAEILFDVAQRSIYYYFSKHGESSFQPASRTAK